MYQEKKGFPPDLQKWSNPCITFSRARLKLGFEIINWPVAWSEELALETNTNQTAFRKTLFCPMPTAVICT